MSPLTLLVIIIALALIFDLINGFHDAANSIATIVSTKVLTPFQAVVWAAGFNVVAFWIFDLKVADTVAKTVQDPGAINLTVVLAGLIAAIFWNLLTWWFGIPSSSSHTLIGGFAGAAVAHAGTFKVLDNDVIIKTAAFIILAPIIGMIISYVLSVAVIYICRNANPYKADRWFKRIQLVSSAAFSIGHGGADSQKVMGIIAAAMLVFIGQQQKINPEWKAEGWMKVEKQDQGKISVKEASLSIENAEYLIKDSATKKESKKHLKNVKGTLADGKMVVTDSTGKAIEGKIDIKAGTIEIVKALGHYKKDSMIITNAHAKVVKGKVSFDEASSVLLLTHDGKTEDGKEKIKDGSLQIKEGKVILKPKKKLAIPNWIAFACYIAIGLGTMMGGWRIVKTMGTKITKVTPLEGVVAETAGAITLYGVSQGMGIPVSTTHTITGAIMGVGMTKRLSAVRWGVTRSLLWAWILTIPVSGLVAALVYWIMKLLA